MKLHDPFFITARLSPGLRVADAVISLEDIMYGERDRATFVIDFADGSHHIDSELQSGEQGFRSRVEIFESFLGFLSACAESINFTRRTGRCGENGQLFPEDVATWAADNQDAIDMAQFCMQTESGGVNHLLIEAGDDALSDLEVGT